MPKKDIIVQTTGVDRLVRKFQKFPDIIMQEIKSEMFKQAEGIMSDSKNNYVPVKEGILKSSGHVKLPEVQGSRITVEMGYGGAAEKYALIVHEDLNAIHKVGQAKYLEIPFKKATSSFMARLRIKLKKVSKRL